MKSNGNSFGCTQFNGECASGTGAAMPLITTGRPPQEHHWWYLA